MKPYRHGRNIGMRRMGVKQSKNDLLSTPCSLP
jgi:hypothetical protein